MQKIVHLFWHNRSRRDKAIVRSVLTAVGAKGCGILLQLIALPYTIRMLGLEVYGTYAAAAALFGWGSMLEVGLSASMIRGMVGAIARKDAESTTTFFLTGMAVVALLVAVIGFILISVLVAVVFIKGGYNWSGSLPLFACAGGLAGMQIITGVAGRARAAFQETHINNLFGAAANLTAAMLLWLLARPGATALTILAALNTPLIIAQILNGITLVMQKPLLRSRWRINWHQGRLMFREGSWLTLGQAGGFLEREAPKLVLAVSATAAAVGAYACAIQLLVIMAGLIIMISSPLMPAMTEAMHMGDHHWWRRRVLLLESAIFALGLIGVVLMALYGPWALGLLFGQRVKFSSGDCAALGCWTTVILGSHALYTTLIAAGRLKPVAMGQIGQGGAILVCFIALHGRIGLGGMFWLAALVTLLVTFLPWAAMVYGMRETKRFLPGALATDSESL